jgi:hypothetical protein
MTETDNISETQNISPESDYESTRGTRLESLRENDGCEAGAGREANIF